MQISAYPICVICNKKDRLAGWLAGWVTGLLAGWLAGWLGDWLAGWLAGLLAGQLAVLPKIKKIEKTYKTQRKIKNTEDLIKNNWLYMETLARDGRNRPSRSLHR